MRATTEVQTGKVQKYSSGPMFAGGSPRPHVNVYLIHLPRAFQRYPIYLWGIVGLQIIIQNYPCNFFDFFKISIRVVEKKIRNLLAQEASRYIFPSSGNPRPRFHFLRLLSPPPGERGGVEQTFILKKSNVFCGHRD